MVNAIFWNIRVRTKKANHRLKNLIKCHKVDFVAILEPFLNMNNIEKYMKYFGFHHSLSNLNGQIWLFWVGNYNASIFSNTDQQSTIKLQNSNTCKDIFITTVYTKCAPLERKDLWEDLERVHQSIQGPWCIGGDFNVILDPDEKLGGKPHRMAKSFDFSSCMNACEVSNLGFIGPKFTWCNNRISKERIWKRLDRVFINDEWAILFQTNIVRHLPRVGSDHRPLLVKCYDSSQCGIKYFKFLNFWVDQPSFRQLVEDTWNVHIARNAQWILQQKLKILNKKLSHWSRNVDGNVFDHVNKSNMLNLEESDLLNTSDLSREELNKRQAEYIRLMNLQDNILKKKAQTRWFEEGDSNTKYFHSVIRERRRRLQLNRIKNHKNKWVQGSDKIAKAAIQHFKKLFNSPHYFNDF
ncbi:putative protein isoform X2 [Capsicum galapagoense]